MCNDDVVAARESFKEALLGYQDIEHELGVADCYLRLGELEVRESCRRSPALWSGGPNI